MPGMGCYSKGTRLPSYGGPDGHPHRRLPAASASGSAARAPPNPCTGAVCTPLFYPGLNGSKCYRIPSIIATHRGTLLAFAENRLGGCGDQGAHNLVLRRSEDGGASWALSSPSSRA